MSDLPPAAFTYQTLIGEYFLSLRGSGLLLSPLDLEQVADWERRGLPAPVVCLGLRHGHQDHLDRKPTPLRAPRSLRAYRRAVERQWTAYREGKVGAASGPADEKQASRARIAAASAYLLAAERSAPSSEWRGFYKTAREHLDALAARRDRLGPQLLEDMDKDFAEIDRLLIRGWIRALSKPERSALGPRCRLLAGPQMHGARPRTFKETLWSHLSEAAQLAGLQVLAGSV